MVGALQLYQRYLVTGGPRCLGIVLTHIERNPVVCCAMDQYLWYSQWEQRGGRGCCIAFWNILQVAAEQFCDSAAAQATSPSHIKVSDASLTHYSHQW